MKPVPPGLSRYAIVISLAIFALFTACEPEELWDRPKVSFAQIRVEGTAVETRDTIILGGLISDIEDPSLSPAPTPVFHYGHIFSTDRNALEPLAGEELPDTLALDALPGVERASGVGLSPVSPGNFSQQRYLTFVDAGRLSLDTSYYYMAYVVRPDQGTVRLSQVAPEDFRVPVLQIETVIPEEEEPDEEMRIRARGIISEANEVVLLEFGHRLLGGVDGPVLDSVVILSQDTEPFTGTREYESELPFFEVNTDYYVQAYVKFRRSGSSDVFTEYDETLDGTQRFRFEPNAGFWVNTERIRQRSGSKSDPPALQQATAFFISGRIYLGLGLGPSGSPERRFWSFDPGFYTWEPEALPNFEDDRAQAVSFLWGGSIYIGLGYQPGSGTSLTSFYRIQPGASDWVLDASMQNGLRQALEEEYASSGVTFAPAIADSLIGRRGAFHFTGSNGDFFFGGGRGRQLVRVVPDSVNCSDCQEHQWNDFNDNLVIESGDWVDLDGDGSVDAGVLLTDDGSELGIDIDNDGMVEITEKDGDNNYIVGVFDPTLGTSTEVIITSGGDELPYGSGFDENPILTRSEWNDSNFDRRIDYGEIETQVALLGDLWRLSTEWELLVKEESQFRRRGASGIASGGRNYLIGGDAGTDEPAATISFNNGGADIAEVSGVESLRSSFGILFPIGQTLYYGGGEDAEGNLLSLNLKKLNPTIPNLMNATGCGLNTLSNGLSLSVGNQKGFIGIGRTEEGLTNEFWMYVPAD